MTHTFATLEVSAEAYDEIKFKLSAAGYEHAFQPGGPIDMHGLALTRGGPGGTAQFETIQTVAWDDLPVAIRHLVVHVDRERAVMLEALARRGIRLTPGTYETDAGLALNVYAPPVRYLELVNAASARPIITRVRIER